MLAEVEYLSALAIDLSPDNASGKVHVVVHLRELRQFVHVVLQHLFRVFVHARGIFVQFAHQHPIGGFCILVGTVSLKVLFHLAATVELVGRRQVTALHLVEDGLRINHAALREVEVHACSQELLGQ